MSINVTLFRCGSGLDRKEWVRMRAYSIMAKQGCALIDACSASDAMETLRLANELMTEIERGLECALEFADNCGPIVCGNGRAVTPLSDVE